MCHNASVLCYLISSVKSCDLHMIQKPNYLLCILKLKCMYLFHMRLSVLFFSLTSLHQSFEYLWDKCFKMSSWAKKWASLTNTLSTLPRGSRPGTILALGLIQDFSRQIWAKVQNFSKALRAGLTNPCDISDSITITPLGVLCTVPF